jgi:hypothetical protein
MKRIIMIKERALKRFLVVTALVLACSDPTGTDGRIATIDGFLARICEIAARCAGVSATQDDIAACPAGLRSKLNQNQLHELEGFTSYAKVQQDHILDCIGVTLCGRFSGRLSAISDSDIMEPYRGCLTSA